MTNAAELSDAQLLSMLAMPALTSRESRGDTTAVGPDTPWGKAYGSTQLQPKTAEAMAAKLGLPYRPELLTAKGPEAADYQQKLGQAYLQEGIEKTGSLQDGLRYYHGGPDKRLWGPKTEAYAQAISAKVGYQPPSASNLKSLSDADLLAALGVAPSAPPRPKAPPPMVGAADKPASMPTQGQMQAFAGVKPTSQGLGFAKGVTDPLVHTAELAKGVLDPRQNQQIGLSPGGIVGNLALQKLLQAGGAVQGAITKRSEDVRPGKIGEFAGNTVATLPAMFLSGGPLVQGAAMGAMGGKGERPTDVLQDMGVGAATNWGANKVVNAAGSILAKAFQKAPQVMNFEQLSQAVDKAYEAARQAGVTYTDKSMTNFVNGLGLMMKSERLNPLRNPKAASMLDEIASLKGQPQTLESLDQLRQVIDRDVANASDKSEARLGKKMIKALDNYISSNPAADPFIKPARELFMRKAKIKAVADAAESANLQNGARYFGGNEANAIRQKLRPFIDPTAAKKIGNLTPDEQAALRTVVKGTPTQNAARVLSFFAPNRAGGQLAGLMGLGTNGLSAAALPVGWAAQAMSTGITKQQLDNLIKLMAVGGDSALLKPIMTPASQAVMKGAKTIAAPTGLLASLLATQAAAKPAPKPSGKKKTDKRGG